MANPYVAVVGNVCSGKSTFISQFSSWHEEWQGLPEKLHEGKWEYPPDADGQIITTFFLIYYANRHLQAQKINGPVIQESCLETNNLFPEAYYELGNISINQYHILKLGNSTFINSMPRPDFYVYLHAPVDVLLARAETRKEPARTISLNLIPIMQTRLENWIDHHDDQDRIFRVDTGSINTYGALNLFEDVINCVRKTTYNARDIA